MTIFSKEFLDEGLQRTEDRGLLAIKQSDIFYNNGFWAARFDKNIFGCEEGPNDSLLCQAMEGSLLWFYQTPCSITTLAIILLSRGILQYTQLTTSNHYVKKYSSR